MSTTGAVFLIAECRRLRLLKNVVLPAVPLDTAREWIEATPKVHGVTAFNSMECKMAKPFNDTQTQKMTPKKQSRLTPRRANVKPCSAGRSESSKKLDDTQENEQDDNVIYKTEEGKESNSTDPASLNIPQSGVALPATASCMYWNKSHRATGLHGIWCCDRYACNVLCHSTCTL